MLFNEMLVEAGIDPADVRLLRHHTQPGLGGMSLYDLWNRDVDGFERYQSTQKEGLPVFRTAKYFAAFVCPDPATTLFAGLYEAEFDGTRQVDWLCPYRGNKPGDGAPVDVFRTTLRPELAEHIGQLEIEWDLANVRTWARYAAGAPFYVPGNGPKLASQHPSENSDLGGTLTQLGFNLCHSTKKVEQFQRGNLVIYVKRETRQFPIVIHPHYLVMAPELLALDGIESSAPPRPYINSNLRAFPVYRADNRSTSSHFGFAVDATKSGLGTLVEFLEYNAVVRTDDGDTRLFGTDDNPLTERERLATARIGQGEFRSALIDIWQGACPVANVDHLSLLRASHIKPWSKSNNTERLDPYNGILLCAHIDALFDCGMISFQDEGKMMISALLGADNVTRLGLNSTCTLLLFDEKHKPYLEYHRKHCFKI
jgi:HNH endonuclease